MDRVEEWVLQNKHKIEKGVEIIGQGCEVLAATVGQLHPILEAVFVASAELLKNPEGKEAKYLAEQFEKINQKLEGIQDEVNRIALEMQLSSMNKQNFDYQVRMLGQYRKFLEFVNAELDSKTTKKGKFIRHYENTGHDGNLDALYNAFIGETTSGVPMLDTVLAVKQRSRRAVEEFCAQLKKLFVVGIIAVIGYTSLKEESVEEKTFNETLMRKMVKKWQGRMEDVEKRMKAAVDDCTQNFATQAKEDIGQLLQEKQGSFDPNLTKSLLDFLAKKYDWVSWSLRVISNREWFFWSWFAGKKYHGWCGGANFFDLTRNDIRVVISFSADPKPINKVQIQEQIEGQKLKGDMESLAQSLCNSLPNCVVHAVSRYKDVVESSNFQEECYYFEKHRKAHLYIHSK
ncbi:hypothetical protein MATL_G00130330 [Megalops atlanticus]|uniref:Rapunzel 5 n=1 Tax=Megalops atlanticus TaxID=7932 RepID=A0A9D3TBW2_MEGAT|nr:hypothetical protein MATL_G00130330 [Megalops atlanticus]